MGSSICPCWERNERESVEAAVGTYGPNCTELLSWALKFAGCQTWWCTSVIQLSEGRRMSLLRPSWISLERLHFEQNRTLYAREPLVQPCILSCRLVPCDKWAVLTAWPSLSDEMLHSVQGLRALSLGLFFKLALFPLTLGKTRAIWHLSVASFWIPNYSFAV